MKSQSLDPLYKSIHKQAEGELENAKIAARNVLEDLQTEKEKLAEANAKEEAILLSIGNGLLANDEKGNITLINKMAEKLLGVKSKEVIGNFFEIISVEDEKGIPISLEKRPVAMALAGTTTTVATSMNFTYYCVRKDKMRFPVAITITPIILNRKIIGTVEVFRDITKEKEIDKAKSEFISLASHQLKTPPTVIKLLTERLLEGKMGEFTGKQKEYINDIHSGNEWMIDLINALLNVSRIELGAFCIQVKEQDVGATVKNILDELKLIINKKRLKLKTIFPKGEIRLMLDEALFRMVISNLIINSTHYTGEGGKIQVECRKVDRGKVLGGKFFKKSSFVVIVSDTGYGIPENDQKKVFSKFFRADNAREKYANGTGLGLYIVKSILEHSGGSIWFTSHENEGSTFYAAIPLTGMKVKISPKELVV